jgi:uncharacterized protein (TIGR02271 family)
VLAEGAVVSAKREDQFRTETEDETKSADERPRDDTALPLVAEELFVTKENRETGRVRISTHTHEREALIDEDLARERVEIETIPIGRRIDTVPEVRHEGDTTVIPVVEERLVVEREVVLKEEIRVRRVRTTERHQEKVALRYQEAVIRRYQQGANTPNAPATDSDKTTIKAVRDKPTE